MANFEGWRGLGELWMEHPARRLSHFTDFPHKRTNLSMSLFFFFGGGVEGGGGGSVQAEEPFVLLHFVFLSRRRCQCYPLESSALR